MKLLQKFSHIVFKLLEWFAIICLVVLTINVFVDVILRYILKSGFSWSQEISTLLLVWLSLIGMAIGILERIHIGIEVFTSKLSPKALSILDSINHILITGFGVLMLVYGIQIMDTVKKSTLPATKWPSSVLYVILPLSGVLVILNSILVAAKKDTQVTEEDKNA